MDAVRLIIFRLSDNSCYSAKRKKKKCWANLCKYSLANKHLLAEDTDTSCRLIPAQNSGITSNAKSDRMHRY